MTTSLVKEKKLLLERNFYFRHSSLEEKCLRLGLGGGVDVLPEPAVDLRHLDVLEAGLLEDRDELGLEERAEGGDELRRLVLPRDHLAWCSAWAQGRVVGDVQ